MALTKDETIHLADLQFAQLCQKRFGINRGVYNTIDFWFYINGVTNILKRRKMILEFLGTQERNADDRNRFRKFGHGGLSARLDQYWQERGYTEPVSHMSLS